MELYQKHIDIAVEEICKPTLETTKQYLTACEIEYFSGKPKIARVNSTYYKNIVAVYFPVKNHQYFIEVHVSKEADIKVQSVWTESGHRIYYTATSPKLSYYDLAKNIKLTPLEGWSKGESKKTGKSTHTFSRLSYEPIKNQAYSLEEKLNLLLDDIELDRDEILNLTLIADTSIVVCRYQYISGNMGIDISAKTFKRISNLNLGLSIDTYLTGEEI